MILSKQDVIARSLNSRREMVYKYSKHILYIEQVAIAYRTQKDTYINPVQTPEVCMIVNTSKKETICYQQIRYALSPALSPGSYLFHRRALS